jgi:hypothetical protein
LTTLEDSLQQAIDAKADTNTVTTLEDNLQQAIDAKADQTALDTLQNNLQEAIESTTAPTHGLPLGQIKNIRESTVGYNYLPVKTVYNPDSYNNLHFIKITPFYGYATNDDPPSASFYYEHPYSHNGAPIEYIFIENTDPNLDLSQIATFEYGDRVGETYYNMGSENIPTGSEQTQYPIMTTTTAEMRVPSGLFGGVAFEVSRIIMYKDRIPDLIHSDGTKFSDYASAIFRSPITGTMYTVLFEIKINNIVKGFLYILHSENYSHTFNTYTQGIPDKTINSTEILNWSLYYSTGSLPAEYAIEDISEYNNNGDNVVVGARLQGTIVIQNDPVNTNNDITTSLQIPYDITSPTGTGKEGEIQIVNNNSAMSLYVSDGTSYQNINNHSINDLTDVYTSTTAPTHGQALVWDNTNSEWKPNDLSKNVHSDVTYTVTVGTRSSSHRYNTTDNPTASPDSFIIDTLEAPYLELIAGKTYIFDQSDLTNTGCPLNFYTDPIQTTLITQYTTGVTVTGTAGSSGSSVELVTTYETPCILYYQCSNHVMMGNQLNIIGGSTVKLNSSLQTELNARVDKRFIIESTEPLIADDGSLYYDSLSQALKVRYNGLWVTTSSGVGSNGLPLGEIKPDRFQTTNFSYNTIEESSHIYENGRGPTLPIVLTPQDAYDGTETTLSLHQGMHFSTTTPIEMGDLLTFDVPNHQSGSEMYFDEGSTSGITNSTDEEVTYFTWGQSNFPAVRDATYRWGHNQHPFYYIFGDWKRYDSAIRNPNVRIIILKNKYLQMRNTLTDTLLFDTESKTYNDGFSTNFSTTHDTYQILVEYFSASESKYYYIFASPNSMNTSQTGMCVSMGEDNYSWAKSKYQVIFLSGVGGTAQAEYAIEDNLDANNNVVGALLQGEIKIQSDTTNKNADVTTTLQIPYDITSPTGTGKEGEIQIVKDNSVMSLYISDGTSYQKIAPSLWKTSNNSNIYYNTGNVGIGNNIPQLGDRLYVDGDIFATGRVSGSWLETHSDDRIKFNEQKIDNSLNLIKKLNVVKYDKLYEEINLNLTDDEFNLNKDNLKYCEEIGVIAQELQNIDDLKFVVGGGGSEIITNEDGTETEKENIYSVAYNNLFNLHISATQELLKKVEILELELKTLKETLDIT